MPSTPLRGWAIPAEYEDEYFTTISSTWNAIDADVNALMTSVRSVPLGGTGQSALTAGSYLKGNGTSAVAFQAAPIPVADGGSGATSFTAGRYLKGNNAGAFVEQAPPIPVADGGTGAITLTGYLKGNGVGAFTAQLPPIPVADGGSGAVSFTAGAYLKGNAAGAFVTQAPPIPVADGGTGAQSFTAGRALYGNGSSAILASGYVHPDWASNGMLITNIPANKAACILVAPNDGSAAGQVGLHFDRGYSVYNAAIEITFGRYGNGDYASNSCVTSIQSRLLATNGEVGQFDFCCENASVGGRSNIILRLSGHNPSYGVAEIYGGSAGVALRLANSNVSGVDRKVGLLLDRGYGDNWDSHEIIWGTGSGYASTIVGALKMNWTGEGILQFSLYHGSYGNGDVAGANVAQFSGSGYINFRILAGSGNAIVYCDASGNIFRTATIPVVHGGTGNSALNGNCALYYNGSVIVGNTAVNVDQGIGVNRATPGVGQVDVSVGIYRNGFVYNNPAYVFEHWATGKIERFADRRGADKYRGVLPLDEIERFAREHHEHPLFQGEMEAGLFDTADRTIEVVEEAYIYLFDHEARLKKLEAQLARMAA